MSGSGIAANLRGSRYPVLRVGVLERQTHRRRELSQLWAFSDDGSHGHVVAEAGCSKQVLHPQNDLAEGILARQALPTGQQSRNELYRLTQPGLTRSCCGSVTPRKVLFRHALQPVGRDVGERAPLLITGVDQGLIERPGHGDRDALWLSRMTGQCHWGAIQ